MQDMLDYIVAEHVVRGYEAGLAGNLKFANCLHYLQDAAEVHANRIGVGLDFTSRNGLIWVLGRYHVRLHRYPRAGASVRVATWPFGWLRLFALREFAFLDAAGGRYGEASSAWLLVRAEGFVPVRPHEHLPPLPYYERRMIDTPFRHLPVPQSVDHCEQYRVRIHDLDVNRHVNNAVYVEWALEAVPADTWNQLRPYEVEAEFIAMAFQGDTVAVEVEELPSKDGRSFLHRITRPADGRELTRLRSRWRAM